MKTLKQVLSAALVLAMLLSCVGAAPGEAEAQDGAPVQSEPFIENAPAPAEEVPAPEENIPAPAEEVPAPAEEVPAPAEEVPAPAEEAPAPAEDEPAPEAEIASVGEAAPVVAGSIAAKNGGWVYEGPVADAADKFVITAPEGYDDAVLALMFATEENGPFNSVIPSNVGTYWVKATWTKTGSEETAVAKTSFTISQKPVTFTLRSGLTKTYTGAEIVLSSKAGDLLTANGLVAADQGAAITINTGVINVQTAKPLDKVDVVIMRGDVPVSGNYAVTVNGNLTVVKASLEGATVTFTNPVYNGTAQLPAAAEVKLNGNVIPDTEYDIVAGAKTVTNVADTGGTATVRAKATAVNVQGSKEGEYSIAAFDLANATVELTDGGREYTGKPLAAPTVVVTGHGQPIPETGNYTVKFPDDLTNAGDKIVTVTAVENGNYKGEQSVTYTVVPKSLTDDMVTLETKQFVYNGTRQEAAVTAVKDGDATLTAGKDYTVAYTSDDSNALIAAGAVTVVVTGQGNYDGDITKTYEIAKKPVTVTAEGTKRFGAKDPTVDSPMADNWLRTTVTGLVNADDVNLFGIKAKRVPGANGELPGTYDIELTVDATKAANYAVTGDDGDGVFTATIKDAFTISTKAAFTVSLGDGKKDASITTHTSGKVGYTITGKDLISDLQNYVDVTMNVDAKDASATLSSHGIQAKNVPATIPGAGGSISIPQVDYASGTMTWQSGLPAGAKLTVTVASKNGASASVISAKAVTVTPVDVNMKITWTAGANRNACEDGDPYGNGRLLLDENGTITIAPEKESDKKSVGDDDWIELTVGGNRYYYSTDNADDLGIDAKPDAHGALTLDLDQLKALVGATGEEGGWFGLDPTDDYLTIRAVLVDNVGHTSESHHINVAFDTGALKTDKAQTVGNRTSGDVVLDILDSVNAVPEVGVTVAGALGAGVTSEDIVPFVDADGTRKLVWKNVGKWLTPGNLPTSGSITVTFRDAVGYLVEHVINVGPSEAVTANTIFVQPIIDGTVPAKALRFYGDTTAWEACTLTVGDSTFPIEPLPGGASYDSGTVKQWQQIVTLGDINFPVGVPTTVSMAYNNLAGGEASIEITYKNEAQTPVIGSEVVAGSELLWGYVESGATVSASVYHTDESVTQIPQDSIAVDQFGYYCIRLGQALAAGEQVVISTSDFCGNVKSVTVDVQEDLTPDAAAELLGANVVGEIGGDIYHRFATPVDLAALAASEDKSMTLPILAYKGIEIGTMTFALDDQDQLQVDYDIKAISYIPDDAKAYLGTFEGKPTIETLVEGSLPVAVEKLKANPSGSLSAIDVSAYKNEDGEYSGVIWLQARFDVDMGVDSYVSRGSRDTRFYRWLTESLQTEDLLGAVYQETSAYEENMTYYRLYQRFENISRHS